MDTAAPIGPPSPAAPVRPDERQWQPTRGDQASANTLRSDEIQRTRAFLLVSGTLSLFGAAASPLFVGEPTVWRVFLVSVVSLVAICAGFFLHIRDERRYSAEKALVVITVCEFAGVAAVAFYGFFSPAPMVMMLPIGFVGLSRNRRLAISAYGIAALMIAAPMLLLSLGVGSDPGLVRAIGMGTVEQLVFTGLVQVVFGAAFLMSRLSRRSTDRAVAQMERAWRQVQEQDWALGEANQELERARAGEGALVGQVHGAWVLERRIGRGGMGDVYSATHQQTRARAALKFLGSRSRDARSLALFEREAALLGTVMSPFVVKPLELHLGDPAWLAMELLEGEELGARLRRLRRLSLAETVALVSHAAEGLSAAHDVGIVHRDVKPGNLFQVQVDGGRIWKLVDFGISKLEDAESTFTRDRLLGTPGYMSPEQLRGEDLNDKSDQFGLAAVAYRALVGRAPFVGRGGRALQYATLSSQPPRPSDFVAVPHEVELVLAIGLAKSPAGRFPTIDAFATAFSRASTGWLAEPVRERAEAVLRKRPWGSSERI